jgi:crotonobetainyl-CoA:carnitine CoA-transferase CaiB-like acyl-CoA transferase
VRRASILDGLVVLDLSRVIAGPVAAQVLGDLGARVIKVEASPAGEASRGYLPPGVSDLPVGTLFAAMNRNKQSVTIDLRNEKGKQLVRRLATQADVFVHNFRPGTVERMGLDYEVLRGLNDRLVYCAISGFGESGPLRVKAGNDLIAQAYSGLMSFTGLPDSEPVRVPVSIGDFVAGYYCAMGALAALYDRSQTGKGKYVSISLLEGLMAMLGHHIADYLISGDLPRPMGSANRLGQPNQAFPTADGWIVISAVNDNMWRRCQDALGLQYDPGDPPLARLADRYVNRPFLIAKVSGALRLMTTAHANKILTDAGVTCGPINGVDELVRDEQVMHLGALTSVSTGDRSIPLVEFPLRLTGMHDVPATLDAVPGASTEAVLTAAGLEPAEIDALRSQGVIG